MKIAIVGAGWFGCHLAQTLKVDHKVSVFEKEDHVFSGASGHNQNRLHLGFHYPRSYTTREFSKKGFDDFVKHYDFLCEDISNNLYAISDQSIVDYQTYLQIMRASKLNFIPVRPEDYGLTNVQGCIKVGEKLILTEKAQQYFTEELKDILLLSTEFTEEDEASFDITINCSGQMFDPCDSWDMIYEDCLILNYRGDEGLPAVTIMDGPFCTLYPKGDGLWSLYCVEHSRIKSLYVDIEKEREKFESLVQVYMPDFNKHFKYEGYETTLRVIINNRSDVRVPRVECRGKVVHVLPSKIDHIFYVEEVVRSMINE